MITLIGQNIKTLSMQRLRFGSRAQESIRGEVHLRVDKDSLEHESPVLFADCELHNSSTINKVDAERCPGDIVRRPLIWHKNVSQGLDHVTLAHMVYSKLIAPFSTVICFFAEDFGGLPVVAEMLAFWLLSFSNRPSDLPPTTHPRVLILTQSDDHSIFNEQDATKKFMLHVGRETERKNGILTGKVNGKLRKAELDKLLGEQFGGMRVLALPRLDSAWRAWKLIKTRIFKDSNEIQARRKDAQVAFSTTHFQAFFKFATIHFCSDIVSPFSFIDASRVPNPVPAEIMSHIGLFLKQVDQRQVLNFAVPIIASALVFDSYPSGMHGKDYSLHVEND